MGSPGRAHARASAARPASTSSGCRRSKRVAADQRAVVRSRGSRSAKVRSGCRRHRPPRGGPTSAARAPGCALRCGGSASWVSSCSVTSRATATKQPIAASSRMSVSTLSILRHEPFWCRMRNTPLRRVRARREVFEDAHAVSRVVGMDERQHVRARAAQRGRTRGSRAPTGSRRRVDRPRRARARCRRSGASTFGTGPPPDAATRRSDAVGVPERRRAADRAHRATGSEAGRPGRGASEKPIAMTPRRATSQTSGM